MSSIKRSPSPKIVFIPLIKEEKSINIPTKIIKIALPGIITSIEQTHNTKPIIIPDTAVGMAHTPQQKTIAIIDKIDIDRVNGKKSSSKRNVIKSPYPLPELIAIAGNLGISAKGKKKVQLAEEIRVTVLQLRNEEEE